MTDIDALRREIETAVCVLADAVTDYNGLQMEDDELPRHCLNCRELRNIASVIQRLLPALEDARRLDALEALTKEGHCPNLVFDDHKNWAVSNAGMQPVPMYEGEHFQEPVMIECFVEPDEWKPTIREAIDSAMEKADGK